ncbi:hypothetical protein CEV31_2118 [Brucella thiophenivorans]|uniref:Uncharacterized protein n=1 Tax=Brucella thiophenivorans TaxID=571255 RepID=A0A256FWG7_9HYPH|nr:hypothetical protein CEV31_2118 [Brucella thiophenivorans]
MIYIKYFLIYIQWSEINRTLHCIYKLVGCELNTADTILKG